MRNYNNGPHVTTEPIHNIFDFKLNEYDEIAFLYRLANFGWLVDL